MRLLPSFPRARLAQLAQLALLATAVLVSVPLGAQTSLQRIDTTYAFDNGGAVRLSIVSGEIRVVGTQSNEIRVNASIERGRIEASFSRLRASLEARSVNNRMGAAIFELSVPIGTRVSASSVSGDIEIRATAAAVTVSAVSGNIVVRDAGDRVDIGTVSGDLDVSDLRGRIAIETVSGEILADELVGDLSVESVSGTIDLRRSRLTGIRAESVSGDLGYDGPFSATGVYSFNTHSGDIVLALPANVGADLELETWSGRIASDFPLTLQPGDMGGRRNRRMEFRIGAGGARISAESFSGNITIRRLPARGNEE